MFVDVGKFIYIWLYLLFISFLLLSFREIVSFKLLFFFTMSMRSCFLLQKEVYHHNMALNLKKLSIINTTLICALSSIALLKLRAHTYNTASISILQINDRYSKLLSALCNNDRY